MLITSPAQGWHVCVIPTCTFLLEGSKGSCQHRSCQTVPGQRLISPSIPSAPEG